MRPNGKKLMCIIGLMVTLSIFIGCGTDGGLLEETETRYNVFVDPIGNDGTTILADVDVVADPDCDGDPVTIDPGSLFSFNVRVTVESDVTTDPNLNPTGGEFFIEEYEYLLRPVSGVAFDGTDSIGLSASQMPNLTDTVLNPRAFPVGGSSLVVIPGVSVSRNLLIWAPGDKIRYVDHLDTFPPVISNGFTGSQTNFIYTLEVVLHCRTAEDDTFTLSGGTSINFANFAAEGECD